MPSDRAPVEDVGGTQKTGPWPSDVEEIAVDDRLKRPVGLTDPDTGEAFTQELEVVITDVQQIVRDDGTETDGYVVSYQFDDPTLDGGGSL